MSHTTIIISRSRPENEAMRASDSEVNSQITYIPSDDLTPQQIGRRVCEILQKLDEIR